MIGTSIVKAPPRQPVSDEDLGLPWSASMPGNHNTDGVMIERRNPAGKVVYVAAVRYQGTIPEMCAEPLANEVIHRVQSHHQLVGLVRLLQEYLSVAADDGAYDSELASIDLRLKSLV